LDDLSPDRNDRNDWMVCNIVNVFRFEKKFRLFLKKVAKTLCIRIFVLDSDFLFDTDGDFDKNVQ